MNTILKKGLEIIEYRDGTKAYKPYAVIGDSSSSQKCYIAAFSNIYFLNKNGYITKTSEKLAIELLNTVIKQFEELEQKQFNKEVVNKFDKEIK